LKFIVSFLLTTLCVLSSFNTYAQSRNAAKAEADSVYKANIKKSRINGVYIPKDATEACTEIIRLSPKESLDKMTSMDEAIAAKKLHFGIGRWIALNWSFDDGSRYTHYLKNKGILFQDDMIDYTLICLHRYLTRKPLEETSLAKSLIDKRKIKQGEVLKTLDK
jgi:hypothetical protein